MRGSIPVPISLNNRMRFRDLTAIKVKRILRTPQTQNYLMPAQGDEEDDAGNVEQGDAEDEDLVRNIGVVSLSTEHFPSRKSGV